MSVPYQQPLSGRTNVSRHGSAIVRIESRRSKEMSVLTEDSLKQMNEADLDGTSSYR